jgi:AcrR family transcriptional regulator
LNWVSHAQCSIDYDDPVSEQERNVPVAWSQRFREGRPEQPALSRDQIIQAARKLLDEEGLEGLSMRRLGARLDSGATSIYWYVAGKDELLDLAMDEVLGEVPIPEPTGDWRADLAALIQGFRTMMFAHPWILQLYGSRAALGPHALRYAEAQLTLLRSAGFAGDELDGAFHMIGDYVRGSVHADGARRARRRRSEEAPRLDLEALLADVTTPYPALRGYREHLLRHDHAFLLEWRFDYGLGVLFDGLVLRRDRLASA